MRFFFRDSASSEVITVVDSLAPSVKLNEQDANLTTKVKNGNESEPEREGKETKPAASL